MRRNIVFSVLPWATALFVLYNSKSVACECREDYQCSPPSELCCDGDCTEWFKCNPPRCISNEYCTHPQFCDLTTYLCTDETIAYPEVCRQDGDCLDTEHCNSSSGKCLPGRRVSTANHLDVEDRRFAGIVITFVVAVVFIIFCLVAYVWYRYKLRYSSSGCGSTGHLGIGTQVEERVSFSNRNGVGLMSELASNSQSNEENIVHSGPPPCYSRTSELPSSNPAPPYEVTELSGHEATL